MIHKRRNMSRGDLPRTPEEIYLAKAARRLDWKRLIYIGIGISLFLVVYYTPPWSDAIDPRGNHFPLTHEGKASIALFLFAGTWWMFEVVPIGVTSIVIGVVQALFLIRPPREVFSDFMDPSVWFIFGSLVIGMVFTKTGLTQRMAYRMLVWVGERTCMIYLGCFLMTAALTLFMAHTAVAATLFPLLMAIYALYDEDTKPTRFGKGLFIGMAFAAGAGSIVTLLGSGRAPVAIGFFKDFVGREISFLEFSYYLFPFGWGMVILIWLLIMATFRPERKTIPGLRERAKALHARLGPLSRTESITLVVAVFAIVVMGLKSFIPVLRPLDNSAIILVATILFFLFKILTIKDLQEIPWNIILLFGGAMSIGYSLWQTHAAEWLAVQCVAMFQNTHWLLFVLALALFVLVATNFIMNVAVIALCLPVALVMARYLGVAPDVIIYSCLVTSGMPFVLLIGAAPNAIAYGSNQFTVSEFLIAGIPASIMVLVMLGVFNYVIWPHMGMTTILAP
jgi:solute carrier family 13 (sodium-dependent dicarboxylate transporter), member 2/3/5